MNDSIEWNRYYIDQFIKLRLIELTRITNTIESTGNYITGVIINIQYRKHIKTYQNVLFTTTDGIQQIIIVEWTQSPTN